MNHTDSVIERGVTTDMPRISAVTVRSNDLKLVVVESRDTGAALISPLVMRFTPPTSMLDTLLLNLVRESDCEAIPFSFWDTRDARSFIAEASALVATLSFVASRLPFRLVMSLLAAEISLPCCVTVFCNVWTAEESAFFATFSLVVFRLLFRPAMLVDCDEMSLPCCVTVLCNEEIAEALASMFTVSVTSIT
ncbi:Uncharacterised protein [Klebsiella pneumoniae]|nr:Uncharacterised protein [Klebsiella pneumoniae]